MSDIPVGSPPVPPGRHAAPSGWYPDPVDGHQERYWDGWQWSRTTRAREGAAGGDASGHPAAWGHAPASGYPPQQGGYPPQQGGYPPQQGGYPPQQGGYPQQAWAGQQPAARQATFTADGVRLAGWGWRLLASLVDSLLLGAVVLLASLPVLLPMMQRVADLMTEVIAAAEQGAEPPPLPTAEQLVPFNEQVLLGVIAVLLGMAYHAGFLRLRSATPGKLVCGLRVVPVDQGRSTERLGWSTVLLRADIWVVPAQVSLLAVFTLLDGLFPLWQPRRQALHDLAARTQVTRP